MDTCDRYELHEAYKNIVKQMMKNCCLDFLVFISEENCEDLSDNFVEEFCEEWVEEHIIPAKFEEEE